MDGAEGSGAGPGRSTDRRSTGGHAPGCGRARSTPHGSDGSPSSWRSPSWWWWAWSSWSPGDRKNSQVDDLRAHGVPVVVTVASASGSWAERIEHRRLRVHRQLRRPGTSYMEGIPGSTFPPAAPPWPGWCIARRPGAVVDAGDGGVLAHHGDALLVGGGAAGRGAGLPGVAGPPPPPGPRTRLRCGAAWGPRRGALPWRMADDPDKPSLSERLTRSS